jgi:metal-dependent amidase/aminoacylase/carboxypeptidase family protein
MYIRRPPTETTISSRCHRRRAAGRTRLRFRAAARETELAASIAAEIVGDDHVNRDTTPAMASEDFAFMLQVKPGAYINVGNGPGEGGCYLHNPNYNFNDDALVFGASYWARLAETFLAD